MKISLADYIEFLSQSDDRLLAFRRDIAEQQDLLTAICKQHSFHDAIEQNKKVLDILFPEK